MYCHIEILKMITLCSSHYLKHLFGTLCACSQRDRYWKASTIFWFWMLQCPWQPHLASTGTRLCWLRWNQFNIRVEGSSCPLQMPWWLPSMQDGPWSWTSPTGFSLITTYFVFQKLQVAFYLVVFYGGNYSFFCGTRGSGNLSFSGRCWKKENPEPYLMSNCRELHGSSFYSLKLKFLMIAKSKCGCQAIYAFRQAKYIRESIWCHPWNTLLHYCLFFRYLWSFIFTTHQKVISSFHLLPLCHM